MQVREKARQIAAHMLEAAVEDVVLENGQYQVRGVPDPGLRMVKRGGDVELVWDAAPRADRYRVWKLLVPNKTRIPCANQLLAAASSEVAPACDTGAMSCTEPGAVAASPGLAYYQVRGTCTCSDPGQLLEGTDHFPTGPVCP